MKRVLVANRGEIAVRVMRACKARGIETVAVYSDADADAAHVRAADYAVHIGATTAADSYLNIERVLDAVRSTGADAVHPGYGFLSENAAFADEVAAAGVTFIGPSAAAMRAVGDKASAKRIAAEAHVPTVPEWSIDTVPADAFPVLLKASAGGGGRGMRIVEHANDLAEAAASARREAAAGFGDDTLLVERLIRQARHVEVQLLADTHGTIIYVGDRDCSLQRRHQKVIEEAPAPGLDDDTRRALGEAAVRIARAAGYVNAGTAEFLVAPDGEWYFLELNARLQVEHPATELAFGIDLVDWQLRIASGEHLTIDQCDIHPVAHAIEARIYAEDPIELLPTGGRVLDASLPHGSGIRVDHAIIPGMEISLAYDPMLAKVIASASNRETARGVLIDALEQVSLPGVITNTPLLIHAAKLHDFMSGTHNTDTLTTNMPSAHALAMPADVERTVRALQHARTQPDPFQQLVGWRAGDVSSSAVALDSNVHIHNHGDNLWVSWRGYCWEISRNPITVDSAAGSAQEANHATLTAPMPGTVITTLPAGTEVRAGEAVVVLEAMKMENSIAAPFDGTVAEIRCEVGDLVTRGAVLAEVTR